MPVGSKIIIIHFSDVKSLFRYSVGLVYSNYFRLKTLNVTYKISFLRINDNNNSNNHEDDPKIMLVST
jgi:hypothetical protein